MKRPSRAQTVCESFEVCVLSFGFFFMRLTRPQRTAVRREESKETTTPRGPDPWHTNFHCSFPTPGSRNGSRSLTFVLSENHENQAWNYNDKFRKRPTLGRRLVSGRGSFSNLVTPGPEKLASLRWLAHILGAKPWTDGT